MWFLLLALLAQSTNYLGEGNHVGHKFFDLRQQNLAFEIGQGADRAETQYERTQPFLVGPKARLQPGGHLRFVGAAKSVRRRHAMLARPSTLHQKIVRIDNLSNMAVAFEILRVKSGGTEHGGFPHLTLFREGGGAQLRILPVKTVQKTRIVCGENLNPHGLCGPGVAWNSSQHDQETRDCQIGRPAARSTSWNTARITVRRRLRMSRPKICLPRNFARPMSRDGIICASRSSFACSAVT